MAPFGFGRRKDEPAIADVYLELRSMVLGLDPAATGIEPTAELPNVWGVVVDWGTVPPAAKFDRPRLQTVTYWLLTFAGLRSASHGPDGPPAGDEALGGLGAAFQDYVSAFRVLNERGAGSPR